MKETKRRYQSYYIFATILMVFFLTLILSPYKAYAQEILTEGKTVEGRMDTLNGKKYEGYVTVVPEETDKYFLYVSESQEYNGRISLYDENENEVGSVYNSNKYSMNNCELEAGKSYRLLVSGLEESSFRATLMRQGPGQIVLTTPEVIINDTNNPFKLEAIMGTEFGDLEWFCDNRSVVSYNKSSGGTWNGLHHCDVTLIAEKNGSATVGLKKVSDGETVISTKVTVSGLTEYYGLYVGGVSVSSANAAKVTSEGISGTVSYDPASNTLTLNNATITKAGFAGFESKGYPVCALGYNGRKTLNLRLIGKNVIHNLTIPNSNPKDEYGYSASLFYGGITALKCNGNLSLSGSGSLTIDDSSAGTGISADSMNIEKGSSLKVTITHPNTSEAIDTNSLTVNGSLTTSNETGRITSYGVRTDKLTVGSSGNINAQTKTRSIVTSHAIYLGGASSIAGKVTAKSFGAAGEKAGIAIFGANKNTTVTVTGNAKVIATGNSCATYRILFKTGSGVSLRTGSSASNTYTMTPNTSLDTQKYTIVAKGLAARIYPSSLSSCTKAAKAFTAKWTARSKYYVDGYQIRYSLKSSMAGAKSKTLAGASKTSVKIKKLKAKKKYYVQIRSYKTVGGKKYYSAWSAKKTVKTK
ncbi:MAG: fibronectin type III domain-containing protein [Eubacterium sp.]|nr:fibronectin type III domain-containing protein [Eubacterium sp.]